MPKPDPKLAADVLATAQVLAWRLPMLGLAATAPTPRRTLEMQRMLAEKQVALASGLWAAQTAVATGWFGFWTSGADPAAAARLVDSAQSAFLAPGRKTLKANARRLGKRKRM